MEALRFEVIDFQRVKPLGFLASSPDEAIQKLEEGGYNVNEIVRAEIEKFTPVSIDMGNNSGNPRLKAIPKSVYVTQCHNEAMADNIINALWNDLGSDYKVSFMDGQIHVEWNFIYSKVMGYKVPLCVYSYNVADKWVFEEVISEIKKEVERITFLYKV